LLGLWRTSVFDGACGLPRRFSRLEGAFGLLRCFWTVVAGRVCDRVISALRFACAGRMSRFLLKRIWPSNRRFCLSSIPGRVGIDADVFWRSVWARAFTDPPGRPCWTDGRENSRSSGDRIRRSTTDSKRRHRRPQMKSRRRSLRSLPHQQRRRCRCSTETSLLQQQESQSRRSWGQA